MVKKQNNNKHKEKREQRREEAKKIADNQSLVNAANKTDDPLTLLSPAFRKYNRNGLEIDFESKLATECDEEIQQFAFQITKENMKPLYGEEWKDKEKQAELLEDTAQYLIARQNGKCVAFCHFRFDMDFDLPVLYCYEIQLIPGVQRKGLGRFMMQLLELVAFQTHMKKVVLTVFYENIAAMNLYKQKLGYTRDETSPDAVESDWDVNYEILSKTIKSKKPQAAAGI